MAFTSARISGVPLAAFGAARAAANKLTVTNKVRKALTMVNERYRAGCKKECGRELKDAET